MRWWLRRLCGKILSANWQMLRWLKTSTVAWRCGCAVHRRRLWWLPWWGDFVYKREGGKVTLTADGKPVINEKYMTEDFLKRIMSHPDVITLCDLPWYDKSKHTLPKSLQKNLGRADNV